MEYKHRLPACFQKMYHDDIRAADRKAGQVRDLIFLKRQQGELTDEQAAKWLDQTNIDAGEKIISIIEDYKDYMTVPEWVKEQKRLDEKRLREAGVDEIKPGNDDEELVVKRVKLEKQKSKEE